MSFETDMADEPIAEKTPVLQRARRAIAGLGHQAIDFITPPKCLLCGTDAAQAAALCASCWPTLNHIAPPFCEALGTPFAFDEGDGVLSPAAVADPPRFTRGRAAVAFDHVSRDLVHALKYGDRQEAGLAMARMMASAAPQLLQDCDITVPVPLHRFRLWQRRFNQAAYLAVRLEQLTRKPCVSDALQRHVATRSQVGLDAPARRRNVRRAFSVAAEAQDKISGRRVLLIDDVRTTGATANACAEALLAAGAQNVDVLTFALVLEPAQLHIDA
jgi:ComF family protein